MWNVVPAERGEFAGGEPESDVGQGADEVDFNDAVEGGSDHVTGEAERERQAEEHDEGELWVLVTHKAASDSAIEKPAHESEEGEQDNTYEVHLLFKVP